MSNRTIAFYENILLGHFIRIIKENIRTFISMGIPYDAVLRCASLTELSSNFGIPITLWNNCMIDSIGSFLTPYISGDTGVPAKRTDNGSFFVASQPILDARHAHSICEGSKWKYIDENQKLCINDIKYHLELGLFSYNRHPDDDFPKIVQSIINQTSILSDWRFSYRAIEHLNNIPYTNQF